MTSRNERGYVNSIFNLPTPILRDQSQSCHAISGSCATAMLTVGRHCSLMIASNAKASRRTSNVSRSSIGISLV